MISEPSEILCSPMPQYCMARKVTASTSGMVMPTTSPGRTSSVQRRQNGCRPWRLCSPRLKKLTASTITTASISTLTNSLTESATALGWSCTCCNATPSGRLFSIFALTSFSDLPSAMMSPPLAIDTPSAITSWPSWRTLTCGGSIKPRLISAMSPSRNWLPEAPRIGMARNCSTSLNWPPTRTCTTSSGVCTAPADSTAFCAPSWPSTWFMSSPSSAKRFCEISM